MAVAFVRGPRKMQIASWRRNNGRQNDGWSGDLSPKGISVNQRLKRKKKKDYLWLVYKLFWTDVEGFFDNILVWLIKSKIKIYGTFFWKNCEWYLTCGQKKKNPQTIYPLMTGQGFIFSVLTAWGHKKVRCRKKHITQPGCSVSSTFSLTFTQSNHSTRWPPMHSYPVGNHLSRLSFNQT